MWKKGQSGNPLGLAAPRREVRELALRHAPKAIRRLVTLIASEDQKVALAAANSLLDRAVGSPADPAAQDGPVQVIAATGVPERWPDDAAGEATGDAPANAAREAPRNVARHVG